MNITQTYPLTLLDRQEIWRLYQTRSEVTRVHRSQTNRKAERVFAT